MHEESLVSALLQQIDEIAVQHDALAIDEVEVELGPLSGVEAMLLTSAFERLREGSKFCVGATLLICSVGLSVKCLECRREFVMDDFRFVCRFCESSSVQILRGDALTLMNVRMILPDR